MNPLCYNPMCQNNHIPAESPVPRVSYRSGDRPIYLCRVCAGVIPLFELVQMPGEIPDRVQ